MINNKNLYKDNKKSDYTLTQYINKFYLKFLSLFFLLLNKLTPFYHTFHVRPKKQKSFFYFNSIYKFKIAIVIQGPINDFNFILETINLYKKNFYFSKIIISTWKGLSKKEKNILKKLNIYLIENREPLNQQNWEGGNLNRQIISTLEGIKLAKNIKCDYVLKTRTDQRICSNNIFDPLINVLKFFPLKKKYRHFLQQRIITISFDALLFRHYGISDILQFGRTSDMFSFWNLNLLYKNDVKKYSPDKKNIFLNSYLLINFLKNKNWQIKWSMLDSFQVFSEFFCIVDKEFFDLFWKKYDSREYRWKSYKNFRQTTEINFYTWLNLYNNYKKFYKINKLKINRILFEKLKKDIWSQ